MTISIFLIALALSMDAFAVAVGKGLTWLRWSFKKALIMGLWFGVFQAAMPLAGYFAGAFFAGKIGVYSSWIAFGLLAIIGGKMLIEGLKKSQDDLYGTEERLGIKLMLPLAVATSIDAAAAGTAFALEGIPIFPAVLIIGVITCVLSAAGTKIGQLFGCKYQKYAEIFGGVILVLIGVKNLIGGL
ncbi:MAG: manganese efflux pump MntP family protein [Oscillospiraceae bacterium]|nr:manganese efflux pump MntP family protein [Oscillospiraceae bacterium]